ncbi:MAG: VOC family protein [Gemmatimonadota bacterium]|nr:VOC family protein [Gemmatimonadota bacterium]
MIDHVSLKVSDLEESRAFYEMAFAPLGWKVEEEFDAAVGFGVEGHPYLWLVTGETDAPVHLAVRTPDRERVDAFHEAALEAGGTDNGAPGPRPRYHESYYAAFVLDPDGNNVEAVCHAPE